MAKTVILAYFLICLIPRNSGACSCGKYSLKKQFKHSDLVFLGEVVAIDDFQNRRHFKIVTFRVSKIWKASRTDTEIKLVAFDIGEACGYPFTLGKSYLVFDAPEVAKAENTLPYPSTHLCTRTEPVERAFEDIAALGKPKVLIYRR